MSLSFDEEEEEVANVTQKIIKTLMEEEVYFDMKHYKDGSTIIYTPLFDLGYYVIEHLLESMKARYLGKDYYKEKSNYKCRIADAEETYKIGNVLVHVYYHVDTCKREHDGHFVTSIVIEPESQDD